MKTTANLMEVDMMIQWKNRGQTKPSEQRDGVPQHCAQNLSGGASQFKENILVEGTD